MRIHEILIESQQLDEGPKLDAFGRGVGQVVGGVAKGVGAVAGGVRGAFTALKKGYQSGKAVVGDDPDPGAGAPGYTAPVDPAARPVNTAPVADPKAAPAPVADPKAAPAPVADPNAAPAPVADPNAAPAPTPPPTAKDINAAGPDGTALAKPQTGAAGAALAKTDAVTDKQTSTKAGETVYAQVKANIDKLDKKGKQRILQLLQKSIAAPAPKAPAAAPGAAPAGGAPAADPGAGAMGQMAKQLAGEKPNTMANAPVSKTNVAKPGNPNAAAAPAADPAAAPAAAPAADPAAATKARGGRKAGAGPSMTPDAIRKRASREAAAKANAAGAGAFGQMVNRLPQQNASKNNYGNALSEALAQRVEMHKQKMFETGLARGTVSVFRK